MGLEYSGKGRQEVADAPPGIPLPPMLEADWKQLEHLKDTLYPPGAPSDACGACAGPDRGPAMRLPGMIFFFKITKDLETSGNIFRHHTLFFEFFFSLIWCFYWYSDKIGIRQYYCIDVLLSHFGSSTPAFTLSVALKLVSMTNLLLNFLFVLFFSSFSVSHIMADQPDQAQAQVEDTHLNNLPVFNSF